MTEGAAAETGGFLPTEQELELQAQAYFATWGVLDRLAHAEVRWNPRLRTTAGRARPKILRIELNPDLLSRVPEAVEQVLAHEAAHLAAVLLHGLEVPEHGEEWQALMRAVGQDPQATHAFPIEGLRAMRYHYLHRCALCGWQEIGGRSLIGPPCGCGPRHRASFRAPRTPAGRAALERYADGSAEADPSPPELS